MIGAPTIVPPAYMTGPDYHDTFGPEVADLCEAIGFAPDPEQRLGLDMLFGFDKKGKSTAFEFACICCRQNMKTGLFKQAALGWLYITDQNLVVWSAHEFSTSQEAFRDMEILIEGSTFLSKRVKKINRANGEEAIELRTGQRLKFKARTKHGGRGLTGDKIVLDEAFALQPDHIGALMPTLSVRPDPQLVYGSSAGVAHSEVLRGIRDRGRTGVSPRLAYCEWCAPRRSCAADNCDHEPRKWDGCQLDNVENWQAGNPLLGRVRANGSGLTLEYVRAEREAMGGVLLQEFMRERMGWWDDPSTADIFDAGKWEKGERENRPEGLVLTGLAVAVAMDLKSSAIVGAGVNDEGVWLRVLQHGPGMNWAVDRAKQLQQTYGVTVVIDGKGPGAVLIPTLERENVTLHVATTQDVLDAFANLRSRVRGGTVLYTPAKELDEAVQGAALRPVGDRFAIGRKASTNDVSPLEAASLAAWQATLGPTPSRSAYESDDYDDEDLMYV